MVLAGGLDGALVIGEMGPLGGVATVEKIAVAAVMAGCLPDYFPVVLAACRAVCQPTFDLAEMQSTTHCLAPLIIVNGPAREACGLASGFGLMGPGHRANASIGRALRLAMINIGGARPGDPAGSRRPCQRHRRRQIAAYGCPASWGHPHHRALSVAACAAAAARCLS
jgi:hypothetical protein